MSSARSPSRICPAIGLWFSLTVNMEFVAETTLSKLSSTSASICTYTVCPLSKLFVGLTVMIVFSPSTSTTVASKEISAPSELVSFKVIIASTLVSESPVSSNFLTTSLNEIVMFASIATPVTPSEGVIVIAGATLSIVEKIALAAPVALSE